MKENDKYYTPQLEEFHIGFIYERCDSGYNYFEDIFPRAINFNSSNCEYEEYLQRHIQYFRVKYLDKEDIESLKFINAVSDNFFYRDLDNVIKSDNEFFLNNEIISFGDYELHYDFNIHKLKITDYNRDVMFDGICKNKSELIKIMQQIGII